MIARRVEEIRPFIVMDVLERAQALEKSGEHIIHLEVGEPDFDTPACIRAAGDRALAEGKTHYTHSLGLLELREAICNYYERRYRVGVSPEQVIVTSCTSPAMLLIVGVLAEPGDEVIISDPRELQAHQQGDTEACAATVGLKKRFLEQHLGCWVEPFAAAVVKGAETGFYRELARLTETFVRWEMAEGWVAAKVH